MTRLLFWRLWPGTLIVETRPALRALLTRETLGDPLVIGKAWATGGR